MPKEFEIDRQMSERLLKALGAVRFVEIRREKTNWTGQERMREAEGYILEYNKTISHFVRRDVLSRVIDDAVIEEQLLTWVEQSAKVTIGSGRPPRKLAKYVDEDTKYIELDITGLTKPNGQLHTPSWGRGVDIETRDREILRAALSLTTIAILKRSRDGSIVNADLLRRVDGYRLMDHYSYCFIHVKKAALQRLIRHVNLDEMLKRMEKGITVAIADFTHDQHTDNPITEFVDPSESYVVIDPWEFEKDYDMEEARQVLNAWCGPAWVKICRVGFMDWILEDLIFKDIPRTARD